MTKKRENLERNWIKSRKQKMGPYVKIFLNGAKKKKKKKKGAPVGGERGGKSTRKVCSSLRSGHLNSPPSGNNLFICFRPSLGCQKSAKGPRRVV